MGRQTSFRKKYKRSKWHKSRKKKLRYYYTIIIFYKLYKIIYINMTSASISFTIVGTPQTFTLPNNVSSIQIEAIGGGGGGGGGGVRGGHGAKVIASYVNLIPGSTYTIKVGGGGSGAVSSAGGGGLTEISGNGIYIIAGGGGGGTPDGIGGDASGNVGGNGIGGHNYGLGGNNGLGGLGSLNNPAFSGMNGTGGNGGNVDFSGNDGVGQNGAGGGSGSYDLSGGKCSEQNNISHGGIGGGGQAVSNGFGGGGGAGYGGGGGGGGINGSPNGGGGGGGSIALYNPSSISYTTSTNGGIPSNNGGNGSVTISYSFSIYNNNINILNTTPLSFTSNLQIPLSTYFIIPKDFTLNITDNAVIDNSGGIVNYGTINITAGSAINNFPGSVYLNEFGGIINNDSSSNSNINSGRFINRGEYNNVLDGSIFTNNLGGVFINKNGGTFSNTGTLVNLPGGIFDNYYNYLTNINYGEVINYGQYIPDIQGLVYPQYHIISDGSAHSLAINTISGDLYTWGANNSGQIGNSVTGANVLVPSKVPSTELSGNIWTTIAGGGNTSFGIRDDYSLYSWGDNTNGHLGINNGTDTSRNYPTIIQPSANWIGVASGINHALALDYNNFLYSWGDNTYGQLGITNNDNKNSPNLTHNTHSTTITDTSNIIIPANINYINIGIVGETKTNSSNETNAKISGAFVQVFNYPVIVDDIISFSIYTLPGGTGNNTGGAGSYVYINDNSAVGVGLIAVAGGNGGRGQITNGGSAGEQTNGYGNNGVNSGIGSGGIGSGANSEEAKIAMTQRINIFKLMKILSNVDILSIKDEIDIESKIVPLDPTTTLVINDIDEVNLNLDELDNELGGDIDLDTLQTIDIKSNSNEVKKEPNTKYIFFKDV